MHTHSLLYIWVWNECCRSIDRLIVLFPCVALLAKYPKAHFKDYISVTSDWISYAPIDDITDAFGPLIQGIEYEVDSINGPVLIHKDSEQTDMLRR